MFMNPTKICSIKLCRLKENKSPRYYAISSKTVKAVALYISNTLCEVFNIFLLITEFPENMTIAKVIPVLKAEDKLCVNDYRPISVLSVFYNIRKTCVCWFISQIVIN